MEIDRKQSSRGIKMNEKMTNIKNKIVGFWGGVDCYLLILDL